MSEYSVSAHSAVYKLTGHTSYVWGWVSGYTGIVNVTSQVYLPGKGWSSSQTRQVRAGDMYSIPLTYGATTPGTRTWRVVATQEGKPTSVSKSFRFTRVFLSAESAGSKMVGQTSNIWGIVRGLPANAKVTSQVKINGRWSSSQTRVAKPDQMYTIPLTYGSNSAGTYTWRVRLTYGSGVLYSKDFKFTRTPKPNPPSTGVSRLANPTDGGKVTTPFGKKPNNNTYWRAFGRHTGADFSWRSVKSRNIYAVDSGTITYRWDKVLGHIAILSADSLKGRSHKYFWYCHLASRPTTGRVRRGQFIGTMGQSGTGANGVHLHLELSNSRYSWPTKWSGFKNPAPYITQG